MVKFLAAGGLGGAPACFLFENVGEFWKIERNWGDFSKKIKKVAIFTVYGNSNDKK